jgi:hypothetical protein
MNQLQSFKRNYGEREKLQNCKNLKIDSEVKITHRVNLFL